MPKPKDKGPPEWIALVVKHVRHCMETPHPPQWRAFMHPDKAAWHVDVYPSTIIEENEARWYSFEVDLSELLGALDRGRVKKKHPRVKVTPEALDIAGFFKGHGLHLVVHFDPPEDQQPEEAPALSRLPSLGGPKVDKHTLN
jgi:hypothetical protein